MDRKDYLECLELEVYHNQKNYLFRIFQRYMDPVTNAVFLFRKMQYKYTKKGIAAKLEVVFLKRKLAVRYGILASPSAVIEKGLRFVHPTSIVIGAHVSAGKNLSLYQNTTLGGGRTGDVHKGNQPTLGDNVTVFANALVLGKVTVGNDVIIGANSLLLDSAEDGSVCVGSPAKCINR